MDKKKRLELMKKAGELIGNNTSAKNKMTLKEISEIKQKPYEPTDAVKYTKSALASASMTPSPLVSIPASVAGAVYDLGTATKYALDGQKEKAKEDLAQAAIGLLPTKILKNVGLKGNKMYKNLRALMALKRASDVKTITESPIISRNYAK
jgi:hypothetical protein